MNRIQKAFENKKAFIPFVTCGDPDLETTKETIRQMVKNKADIIELGIPFSDPTAEGPVIQEANIRALKNKITTDDVFEMVKAIRKEVDIPFVFMTYANVVFSYGAEDFMKKCNEVGIDGLILPDVPYEEKEEFIDVCKEYGVTLISMVSPTTDKRIAKIAKEAEGFIYVVSSLGVTGTRSTITTDLDSIIANIRANTNVPCAIGFGISTPKQADEMSKKADGVIVGSAIVKYLAKYGQEAPNKIGEYVKSMKEAMI